MPHEKHRLVKVHIPLLAGETQAQTAMLLMARQMRIVHIQFDRIRGHAGRLDKAFDVPVNVRDARPQITQNEYLDTMSMLFGDIHFLLVTVRGIDRLFDLMCDDIGEEPELALLRRKYKGLFGRTAEFRNHLEHIDERVKKGITGLGDVRNTIFSFDGKTFDFGLKTEEGIREFHKECQEAYHTIMKRRGQKPFGTARSSIKV